MSDVAEAPFERFEIFGPVGPDSPVNPYPTGEEDWWASSQRVADVREEPAADSRNWAERARDSVFGEMRGWTLDFMNVFPKTSQVIADRTRYATGPFSGAVAAIAAPTLGGLEALGFVAGHAGEGLGDVFSNLFQGIGNGLGLGGIDKQTLIVAGVVLGAVLLSR